VTSLLTEAAAVVIGNFSGGNYPPESFNKTKPTRRLTPPAAIAIFPA
jgi:hypothetical protein